LFSEIYSGKGSVNIQTVENLTGWIDLNDYAEKYGVSVSTLRRRVRSRTIPFKLFKGRYWLEDSDKVLDHAPLFSRHESSTSGIPTQVIRMSGPAAEDVERLRDENKSLRAEIDELKTLVKALEAEVDHKQHADATT
jgi:hypothetical protein